MRYVIVSEVRGAAGIFNNNLRKEVLEQFGARSSKLPAHITLKAPFEYDGDLKALDAILEHFVSREWAQPYQVAGYNHFDDRVIYMDVQMSSTGKAMHDRLIEVMGELPYIHYTETDGKDKVFHVTISSKKIQGIYTQLWDYVHEYPCIFDCWFDNITIYRWGNNTWELDRRYELEL
ncbi:MAG: 2'-5' RNA ligase family protein [Cellulosilyticaceae bacterium]